MESTERTASEPAPSSNTKSGAFLVDLVLYLAVMFLVREIYFPRFGFIANGLFWSLTTLVVATWRMRARGISWADLGLRKPRSVKRVVVATASILGMAIASIVIFEILKDQFAWGLTPDTSPESAVSKFGDLEGNWTLFFMIIPFIWLESLLEEVLDRGFLMNWIERMFFEHPPSHCCRCDTPSNDIWIQALQRLFRAIYYCRSHRSSHGDWLCGIRTKSVATHSRSLCPQHHVYA